jgi:hypothetical protein
VGHRLQGKAGGLFWLHAKLGIDSPGMCQKLVKTQQNPEMMKIGTSVHSN